MSVRTVFLLEELMATVAGPEMLASNMSCRFTTSLELETDMEQVLLILHQVLM